MCGNYLRKYSTQYWYSTTKVMLLCSLEKCTNATATNSYYKNGYKLQYDTYRSQLGLHFCSFFFFLQIIQPIIFEQIFIILIWKMLYSNTKKKSRFATLAENSAFICTMISDTHFTCNLGLTLNKLQNIRKRKQITFPEQFIIFIQDLGLKI